MPRAIRIGIAASLGWAATAAYGQACASGCATTVSFDPIGGEVWTLAGSPYCVTTDIEIADLTIQPGVCVVVDGAHSIDVTGQIKAIGTEDAPITFRAKEGGPGWLGIGFDNVQPGSVLQHCVIEGSSDSGLTIINTSPTIKSCRIANNTVTGIGAGVHAELASGELILEDCVIEGNSSTSHGGGMSWQSAGGMLVMDNCTIRDNVANPSSVTASTYGGGLYAVGDVVLTQVTVKANAVYSCECFTCGIQSVGGGVFLESGTSTMDACVISENVAGSLCSTAYAWGGGAYVHQGTLTATNTILSCNEVSLASVPQGAGLFVRDGDAVLANCTLANNNLPALQTSNATATALNSILFFNNSDQDQVVGDGITITYSCIQNGYGTPDDHNIAFNPSFAKADGCTWCELILNSISLCVDAGDPASVTDPECVPPAHGSPTMYDMGAFGGPGSCLWEPLPVDCNQDFFLNILDFVCFQQKFQQGDPQADCNGDGVLNILDFVCFQLAFQAGCS